MNQFTPEYKNFYIMNFSTNFLVNKIDQMIKYFFILGFLIILSMAYGIRILCISKERMFFTVIKDIFNKSFNQFLKVFKV
jgi:hypothetical protein